MAKRGRKPKAVTPTNVWEMAARYEIGMAGIDAEEAEALAKFAKAREALKAQTPKGILDLVKLKQKAALDDIAPPAQTQTPEMSPDMTEAELEAATAPQVAPETPKVSKPNGKSNGHQNGHQARAQA